MTGGPKETVPSMEQYSPQKANIPTKSKLE